MSVKEKKKKVIKLTKYDWYIYAISYLKMAEIGIEELKNRNYVKRGFDEIFFYENKWLLIPIIWNLKHAMELVVKTLGITIDKQYIREHDLAMLSDDLNQLLKKIGIEKPDKIEELAMIILKYYKCEFWDKKLVKAGSVSDISNDIFRFPESKEFFKSDMLQILKDIPFNDELGYSRETEELSEDIKKLGSLFGIINAQTERSKFNKKIKKSKS